MITASITAIPGSYNVVPFVPRRHRHTPGKSASIAAFPARRQQAIWVLPGGDDPSWLVLAGSHGWIHSDYEAAVDDAKWLSINLNLPIREKS